MSSYIRYIERKDIDDAKWNQCMDEAINGLVYGYSFYLDKMARHWSALVLDDYAQVMPLTWNKKWGFYYLYQPPFCAQLGVFGKKRPLTQTQEFVDAIPAKFRLTEIDLNAGNQVEGGWMRNNYVLPLQPSYMDIFRALRESTQRNIKKAAQLGCYFKTGMPVEQVIELATVQSRAYSNITLDDYRNFAELFQVLHAKGRAITAGVYSPADQLIASCVFFFSHKRAYYILVGNHPNGKTIGASHLLIDRFIHQYAGQDLLLDFEGSDLPNLAFFYSSFGATIEKYPALRINNLPWWAKMFK